MNPDEIGVIEHAIACQVLLSRARIRGGVKATTATTRTDGVESVIGHRQRNCAESRHMMTGRGPDRVTWRSRSEEVPAVTIRSVGCGFDVSD